MEETIACAAIWYKEQPAPVHTTVPNGLLLCGFSHAHIISTFKALTGKRSVVPEAGDYEQGFMTNRGRYVGRIEAYTINCRTRGLTHIPGKELYSEDLHWP